MAFSTGKIINKRYRIVKSITQGGFGQLYRAWDLSLKRPCAIKQNLEKTQEGQEQFETEARILADLHHPHLARVTDYFSVEDEGQFLVMDYVDGEDLQSMLDKYGPLPEEKVITWINQVCEALTYIHSQNPPIIHRDIKPANIRITPEGKAVLVDFGIAKTYAPDKVTVTGARAVTPGYAPIEQYGWGRTDARTDIYAIGATLYTLLTGQEPPESINIASGSPLPKPRSVNVQISTAVEDAVLTAMALQPEGRYQTIPALQAALKIEFTQPSRVQWLPKATLAVLGVLLLVDLLAIITGFIQFSTISRIIQGEDVAVADILNYDRWHQTIILVQLVTWVLASVFFLAWIYDTTKYLTSVVREFKYTPVWAALGFLVPFLNLVHPYQVVKEIWRASAASPLPGDAQQPSSSTRTIAIWWTLSLISVLFVVGTLIFSSGNLSLYQLRTVSLMFMVSYLINGIAVGLTILIINKINQMPDASEHFHPVASKTMQIE